MMRYIPIDKFQGVNENGLTYNEAIQKHVQDNIDSFLYYSSHINDSDGEINWMNIASVGNTRFVLSIYYNRELEKIVPSNIAEELKRKIAISVGLDQLLNKE